MAGDETRKSNEIVIIESGPGTADYVRITADGRRWVPCDSSCDSTGEIYGYLSDDEKTMLE